MSNINIELVPTNFVDEKGKFKKDEAIRLGGLIAGVCYDEEGFNHIVNEDPEKTEKRIKRTLDSGHHSVYDHTNIIMNIHQIPKILAMVLNNEQQYTTSEKSARYTKVVRKDGSVITEKEERLYNKWLEIYQGKIKAKYGHVFDDSKIRKLAQENARYLVTVFMPTEMIYTTSFRQINYVASFMEKYILEADLNDPFQAQLVEEMIAFVKELDRMNILEDRLMKNEKYRSLKLFGKDLDKKEIHFGDVYSTVYKGSFAELAQAHRHRSLKYEMERLKGNKDYIIPNILIDDPALVDEWMQDIHEVADVIPQGELVRIHEMGNYDDFLLKCKERLCSAAQLEIMQQTKATLLQYKDALKKSGSPLYEDIEKHSHGARCTFPDYDCLSPCGFDEGINLKRHI